MSSRRSDNVVHLLKQAQFRLSALYDAALEPQGITGRELGVLLAVDDGEPPSQQDVARRLGIDRTSMVGFIDALEAKGLVQRHPHAVDRRRNVIELTDVGRETMRKATVAGAEVEREFFAPLKEITARQLKDALWSLIQPE
jgi:DNA-binding MarR family transcriptional regulator